MKIQSVAIESIIPYENNPKQHPDEQIEKLAREIKEVGFTQPIVVDKNNVIVAGHGRRLAAIKLGINKVPVYKLDSDVSEHKIAAMRLFDNRINQTGVDSQMLAEELKFLKANEFDLSWTGFDKFEIDSFLAFDLDLTPIDLTEEPQEQEGGVITEGAKSNGFKQVQLLFTPKQYEIFKEGCDLAGKRMSKSNMTDTIFAILEAEVLLAKNIAAPDIK